MNALLKLLLAAAGLVILASCEITPEISDDDDPASGATVFDLYTPAIDPDAAFNIVFVPSDDYGDMSVLANRQAFADDAADVIMDGFWQNRGYFNALFFFNYYYMTATGTITANPPDAMGNFRCPTVTWPATANTDAAFADQLILLHQDGTIRDCGGNGRVSSIFDQYWISVHESGHGVFGLPDEYCCDGGYFVSPPVMYATRAACVADAANAAWRNCVSHTSSRDGSTWWRSQGNITTRLIMRNVGPAVHEAGPADWSAMNAAYSALPGSPTITPPADFAPDTWSYTVP